jgi:hypothetical protein
MMLAPLGQEYINLNVETNKYDFLWSVDDELNAGQSWQ